MVQDPQDTADHMVMSKRVSAHVASFFEVDFTRVGSCAASQQSMPSAAQSHFLAFIAKACAENLRTASGGQCRVSGDSTI